MNQDQPPSHYGRSFDRSFDRSADRPQMGERKRPGGKGHETVLAALREKSKTTHLITLAGSKFTGKIVANDLYTITLLLDGNVRRIFYKHALESFYTDSDAHPVQ